MFLLYALAGSATIIGASYLRREPDKYRDCCVALGVAVFCLVGLAPTFLLSRVEGARDFDLALAATDRYLHMDTTLFASWCYSTPWARELLLTVYVSLPLALSLIWLLSGRSVVMLRAVVVSTLVVFIVYVILPATGPAHAFTPYPGPGTYNLDLNAPRNAFPSMHMTWALIGLTSAKGKRLHASALVFVVLTGLACVGSGEHYMIDLVAAVPFTVIVLKGLE